MADVKIAVAPTANRAQMTGGKPSLDDFADRAGDIGDALNAVASSLGEDLDRLAEQQAHGWKLDQVALAFSLQIQGQTTVIVASASATAGMQATMTWTRHEG
jgi:aryl-alcohol dehydrogenase-like predicted oxidoreductase